MLRLKTLFSFLRASQGLRRGVALSRPLTSFQSGLLVLGVSGLVWYFEHKRSLRERVEPALRHDARNAAIAALSALTLSALEKPLVDRLSRAVQRRGWGLLPRLGLAPWAEVLGAVLLLDYTLYVWHVLTHELPFLWRLHRVHHADLDLNASTAVRFHFAEMAMSVPWRAAQIVLIGAAPLSLSVWQTLTLASIIFHHSNVALPACVERWLCRLLMTPRMHGIHHSVVAAEMNSNWSTIFSWPDYLHKTTRLDVPRAWLRIGVPEFRDPAELSFVKLVTMPWRVHRPDTSRWLAQK